MSDILKELEDTWGVQRELWSLEQWKNAAILCANSYNHLANLTDDMTTIKQEERTSANALIKLLQERLKKSEALNTKLTVWINDKLIKNPVGRPLKTRQSKPLRTLGDLWQPTPKRGQPPLYSNQEKEMFIAIADAIKNDHKIKSDIEAMKYFCRNIPARSRRTETEKSAKLLSRFRKEIAKLKNNYKN